MGDKSICCKLEDPGSYPSTSIRSQGWLQAPVNSALWRVETGGSLGMLATSLAPKTPPHTHTHARIHTCTHTHTIIIILTHNIK